MQLHAKKNELCHFLCCHITAYILTNVNSTCQVDNCQNKKRPLVRVVHCEVPLLLAVILDGVSVEVRECPPPPLSRRTNGKRDNG